MKKVLLLTVAAVFALASCTDKPKNGSKLTPDENKAKLEEIGLELADLIDPDAFNDFTGAVSYLINELPELPFWEDEGDYNEPVNQEGKAGVVSGIMKAATPLFAGKLSAATVIATRAAEVADYAIADIYGIYTHDDGEWVEAESTEKFEIAYKYNGQDVKITIAADPDAKTYTVTSDGETAEIPAKVTAKMTKGTASLADVTVDVIAVAEDATSGEVKVAVAIAGYTVAATAKVNNTSASATASVKKGAALLVSAKANGTGSNLTSDYDDYDPTIGSVNGTISIMDKAYLKMSSANFQKYLDGMDELEEEYEYESSEGNWVYKPYDEKYVTTATKLFNDNIKIFLNYDDSSRAAASYEHKVVLETQPGSEWTSTEDVSYITFPDGSKFSFEDYFDEKDFEDVIDTFEDIAEKFEAMWN